MPAVFGGMLALQDISLRAGHGDDVGAQHQDSQHTQDAPANGRLVDSHGILNSSHRVSLGKGKGTVRDKGREMQRGRDRIIERGS